MVGCGVLIVLWGCGGPCAGDVLSAQATINSALRDEGISSTDCQKAICEVLQCRAESGSGVIVCGKNARVSECAVTEAQAELPEPVPIERYIEVFGHGPSPMRVYVPFEGDLNQAEVYWRSEPGLFVRQRAQPLSGCKMIRFDARCPGRFAVRRADRYSALDEEDLGKLLDFGPVSADPLAKKDWRLYRVEPERIGGPVPVILVHGLGAGRWGDFIHWAAYSQEAAAFREAFQLWDFHHPPEGVDAAIGFSPGYPAFEESIVAYLDRFIRDAAAEGVVTDEIRYWFPEGPYALVGHSQGGLKILAFLANFPEQAERVFAAVSIGAPLTGTPWSTPEWLRQTLSRVGISLPTKLSRLRRGLLAELVWRGYINVGRQSDLDPGWGNFDAAGGNGIPVARFRAWRLRDGFVTLTLSPRDANQTGAREWPGFSDTTFEPEAPLGTYCGGIEHIVPEQRGEPYVEKLFLYGSYIAQPGDWLGLRERHAGKQESSSPSSELANRLQNTALRVAQTLMGHVESAGPDAPLGVYALGDGFVPLQSQLMLDGTEEELIYETVRFLGWRYPRIPYRDRRDLIEAHTLGNPERLRIWEGWSHLDTVTGRYNTVSGSSVFFATIAQDLLDARP